MAAAFLSADPCQAQGQIGPYQVSQIRASIADRIEALTILGGDFGLSDGDLKLTAPLISQVRADERLSVTKLGGAGDVGDPLQLGDSNISWQPRIQGDVGYLHSTDVLHSPLLNGDRSEFTAEAIEFGGGARFWMSDSLSVAPTCMGVYGQTRNLYFPQSLFARLNLDQLRESGLIDWRAAVWSLRPSLNIQYLIRIDRSILTLSSDMTYFHTEGFSSSNAYVRIDGESGFLTNKFDVDVPLGIEMEGHELRAGGYLARTNLAGDLERGLGVQHLNEVHARLALDFLNQWWRLQWLGMGASYSWGTGITGWSGGLDIAFRF